MAEPKPKKETRDADAGRLATPLAARRSLLPQFEEDSFGRFAENFARFMGTGQFLFYMTVFIIVWVSLNFLPFIFHWDPYPFILLNLVFSTQASYSAPLILLAQNRQEERDRVQADDDRRVAAQSRADMDFLAREVASLRTSVGELATRDYIRSEIRSELRDQLRDLLAELDRAGQDQAGAEPPVTPGTDATFGVAEARTASGQGLDQPLPSAGATAARPNPA